jgi:competence protein ComEC
MDPRTARKRFARWQPARRCRKAAGLAALAASAFAAAAGAVEPTMKIHAIDVGQGSATLLELSCAAVLVDTGGERTPNFPRPAKVDGNRLLLRYLRAFFQSRPYLKGRLAGLILTHPHADHMRSLRSVLTEFRPKNVVWNGQPGSNVWHLENHFAEFGGIGRFVVRQRDINAVTGLTNSAIDPVVCSGVDPKVRVLWGRVEDKGDWYAKDFTDDGNHSVVVRVDFGVASTLITGDLEKTVAQPNRAGIERLMETYAKTTLLDADVYVAGNHGAENGTTPELLERVTPKIALINAGPPCPRGGDSAHAGGLPSEVSVGELELAVASRRAQPITVTTFREPKQPLERTVSKAIYSTSWDGNIVLEATANGAWSLVSTSGAQSCD